MSKAICSFAPFLRAMLLLLESFLYNWRTSRSGNNLIYSYYNISTYSELLKLSLINLTLNRSTLVLRTTVCCFSSKLKEPSFDKIPIELLSYLITTSEESRNYLLAQPEALFHSYHNRRSKSVDQRAMESHRNLKDVTANKSFNFPRRNNQQAKFKFYNGGKALTAITGTNNEIITNIKLKSGKKIREE